MKKIFTLCILLGGLKANSQVYHSLASGPFSQNWTNTGLITTNNDWSGVPSIQGFLGDDPSRNNAPTDPQTLLQASYSTTLNINANKTSPTDETSGGNYEFEITNPVVGFQGSGTADAPNLVVYLNTTGRSAINFSFLIRDLDLTDVAIQPVAVQYRVGTTGDFTNIPAAFVADGSADGGATLTTPVSFTLPVAAENQAQVEVRIMTTNAIGSDAMLGIDDILVSQGSPLPLNLISFTGSLVNRAALLSWASTNEVNVKGFAVEKGLNGTDFSEVAFVEAKNNANQNDYSFEDINVKGGTNFYRLKMIDKDGSARFSPIVLINNNAVMTAQVFPNPAKSNLNVTHAKALRGATVKIMDLNGKLLKVFPVQAGATQTGLGIAELVKGNYVVVFENNGTKAVSQFTKQ